jgi:hypothetical protein
MVTMSFAGYARRMMLYRKFTLDRHFELVAEFRTIKADYINDFGRITPTFHCSVSEGSRERSGRSFSGKVAS